jgi:hypothetical protein
MIKDLRPFLTSVALTALVLAALGSGTPQGIGSLPTSFSEKQRSSTPFVDRGDYSERVGLAMRDALAGHRFVNPWIVVRGSDEALWFVADRFESEHRFDRVKVCVTLNQHVTATITAYLFGPSDWAILGAAFSGFRPEAKLIAGEIAGKLSGPAR